MSAILIRRGVTEEWESNNPILRPGELGVDLQVGNLKIGNGTSRWNDLEFISSSGDPVDVDFPVDSVNGKTGAVTITLSELGGAPLGHTHTPESIGAATAGHTHSAAEIGAAAAGHTHTAAQVGAIPTGGAIPVGDITLIDTLSQAEYDALPVKSATTLYLIVG